eukprot:3123274-Amphidinium_carterae.1
MDGSERRQKALEEIERKGFCAAPAEVQGDREIVLAVVKTNGCELKYAAEHCWSDREIVLTAVRQSPFAFRFAAGDCNRDEEI